MKYYHGKNVTPSCLHRVHYWVTKIDKRMNARDSWKCPQCWPGKSKHCYERTVQILDATSILIPYLDGPLLCRYCSGTATTENIISNIQICASTRGRNRCIHIHPKVCTHSHGSSHVRKGTSAMRGPPLSVQLNCSECFPVYSVKRKLSGYFACSEPKEINLPEHVSLQPAEIQWFGILRIRSSQSYKQFVLI